MIGVLDEWIQPAPAFSLRIASSDPLSVTIVAAGELDLAARDALATALRQHANWPVVALDVSRVTFLDCSCTGVLVASHHLLQMLGGRLTLLNVNRCVERMLEITNLKETLLDAATAPTPPHSASRVGLLEPWAIPVPPLATVGVDELRDTSRPLA